MLTELILYSPDFWKFMQMVHRVEGMYAVNHLANCAEQHIWPHLLYQTHILQGLQNLSPARCLITNSTAPISELLTCHLPSSAMLVSPVAIRGSALIFMLA